MKSNIALKPQDVLILLKLILAEGSPLTYADLAAALHLSQSEVFEGLKRAQFAGLVDESKRIVFRQAFTEFLIYGLRHVFPATPGRLVRGLPTAHAAEPVSSHVRSSGEAFVWPDPHGSVRGQEITPLYPTVPEAAKKDKRLYELLVLIDALRVGRVREKVFAKQELEHRLKKEAA